MTAYSAEKIAPTLLYLHGFASSPHGRKVDRIRELLSPLGIRVDAPDLNQPSFENLDFEAMVSVAWDFATRHHPAVIVGSSMGSVVALELSRRGVRAPLVLVAPAIGVDDLWLERIPGGDPIWVFNYAVERELPIHRLFFEQISRARPWLEPPSVRVTLIMGTEDEQIPFERVEMVWRDWKRAPCLVVGSELVTIQGGDHRLIDHMDRIVTFVQREIEKGSGIQLPPT